MHQIEWFEKLSNGLLALCTGLAAILAVRSGRKKAEPAPEPGRMEVAGALIDSKEAQALRSVVMANTVALERNSEAAEKSAEAIDDVRTEMRELRMELRLGSRRD